MTMKEHWVRTYAVPVVGAALVVGGWAAPALAQTASPTLSLNASPTTTQQGTLAEFSGRLTGVTGQQVVVLQRRAGAGSFGDSKRVSTDFHGAFDTTLAPPVTSDFRVVYNDTISRVLTIVVVDRTGAVGPTGPAGATGATGATGANGATGAAGS
ncbi:MAG: hypothetical protein JWN08_2905, partial [Frankiales bacterium]|nr:hypothetical protein [Frankiales bacterium]